MEQSDWSAAEERLRTIALEYVALLGQPGVNTALCLTIGIAPLARRFRDGERTPELHAEIMALQ